LTGFSTIHAAAQVWLDTVANVRIHGETQQRPVDLLAQEQPRLGPLNPHPTTSPTLRPVSPPANSASPGHHQYSVPPHTLIAD